nr:hypothetical protein [Tanacetum cinerariifolium]
MSSITAQQTKLHLELVSKEKRLDIRECNGRIPYGLETKRTRILSRARCSCSYSLLLSISHHYRCSRSLHASILKLCGQDFDSLPSEEDTVSFLELGHTGVINSLNDVVVDQMHQPWRTFDALIKRDLSGKTTGLDKLHLSRAQIFWDKALSYRKQIGMHTSKDDYLVNTLRFVSAKESTQIYGKLLPETLTCLDMKESKAYKTYLGYASGVVPPKISRKFKKASPSKKDSSLVPVDDKPAKKETQSKRNEKVDVACGKGIELLSEVAFAEKAQIKEVRKEFEGLSRDTC